jgi:two-component system response regulator CpxR
LSDAAEFEVKWHHDKGMETRPETGGSLRSILLVEDDTELCSLMNDFLSPQGFRLEAVHDGRQGLARALEGDFDLVVLDVMLPVLNGFELLRMIRKRSVIPVIMLTARTAQEDRITGLNAGADDYLPKPFGPEELLARIRAVLRRVGKAELVEPRTISLGGLELNPQTREVWLQAASVQVTTIEFDILEFLMRSAGRAVSRDELMAILYQRESTPYERSLDVHISHLRKKLESADRTLIQTVRGVGYLFAPRPEQPKVEQSK